VVNVIIKNGTNQFHGAVWSSFFRNDDRTPMAGAYPGM